MYFISDDSGDREVQLWNLQQYCHSNIGRAGRLVVFMKGSPSNPVDYYSQSLMLMLEAAGLDISRFKAISIEQRLEELDRDGIYYFDVYDNGDEIKELFYKSSYLRSSVVKNFTIFQIVFYLILLFFLLIVACCCLQGLPLVYVKGNYIGSSVQMPMLYQTGILQDKLQGSEVISRATSTVS